MVNDNPDNKTPERQDAIEELVHLYVDGAFTRRELMDRVSRYAGGWGAATLALAALGVSTADAQSTCAADVRVPENAAGIQTRSIVYNGENVTLMGYLA